VQPLCERGCGRPAFARFTTCCTLCQGPEGPHKRSCVTKCQSGSIAAAGKHADIADTIGAASVTVTTPSTSTFQARSAASEEVQEDIRTKLAEWKAVGAMRSPGDVDEVIQSLSRSTGMEPQAIRMIWMSVVRQARPTSGPAASYVRLTKEHHGLQIDVVDLGQYSAEHSNSCMFLTCAVTLADRRLSGFSDAELPGLLGEALDASFSAQTVTTEDLVEEHHVNRGGVLGRMADALRHAACEVLIYDEEFYRPFFHPVGSMLSSPTEDISETFKRWVKKLRGDEEGDELVMLALSRLCGMAIQTVQQSGYRVPVMDPTGAAESGYVVYWGNDDKHWVWLRPKDV